MSFPLSFWRASGLTVALAVAAAQPLFGFSKSGTTYTTDGSQADVAAAIADSSPGNIVNIPAGTFTWGTGGTSVYVNDAITLAGAGPGATIINLDPTAPTGTTGTIVITAAAVVKGFTLNAPAFSGVVAFSIGSTSGWRITNLTYTPGTTAQIAAGNGDTAYFCFISQSYGLIDSCNITGGGGSDELIFATGPLNSWQTPDSLGGANNVYVEDCTFNGPGYVCDANANARLVVRFCTITGQMKIDAHGFASNTPRGVREIEVYDNAWTYNQVGAFAEIELRGGTGMVFNNTSVLAASGYAWYFLTDYGYQGEWPNFGVNISGATVGSSTIITTATPHGYQSGWNPIYVSVSNSTPTILGNYQVTIMGPNAFTLTPAVSVTGAGTSGSTTAYQTLYNYPITDQIGVGEDPKVGGSDPLYSWNNLQNGTPWPRATKTPDSGAETLYQSQVGNPAASFAETDVIATDRDVFMDLTVTGTFNGSTGIGTGTTAQMSAITTAKTGVGFWVTDQGTWNNKAGGTNGQLYVWSGSGWVLKYTPYTYPNPLRAPVPPSNLTISSP